MTFIVSNYYIFQDGVSKVSGSVLYRGCLVNRKVYTLLDKKNFIDKESVLKLVKQRTTLCLTVS